MHEPMIQVDNLIKRYKKADKNSVDDVSFSVNAGEFVSFLGPNGAGKTTTISILTTTLNKTSGTVLINGKNLDTQESSIRQDIGIIFQKPSLDEALSAEENIRVHAGLYNVAKFRPTFKMMEANYQNTIYELMDMVGLKGELHKPVKTFSGGMKRKLEIVRSLIHKPKILFLDEPTTGLDPVSRRTIWEYLDTIRKEQNTTIFLTTHYLDEAEGCDNILIINDGKILMTGTPQKIKDELQEDYLILESENRADLVKELGGLKVKFTLEDNNQFLLNTNGAPAAQSIIQKIRTPLTSFKLYQPTLEQAYIKLIEKETE
jgi:ABC-2 type transport system ATP-binding protein